MIWYDINITVYCKSRNRTWYGRSQCFYRASPEPVWSICIKNITIILYSNVKSRGGYCVTIYIYIVILFYFTLLYNALYLCLILSRYCLELESNQLPRNFNSVLYLLSYQGHVIWCQFQ